MPEETQALARLVRQVALALHARGAVLSMHFGDGDPPQILYADDDVGISPKIMPTFLDAELDYYGSGRSKELRWIKAHRDGANLEILLVRTWDAPGRTCLLLSIYFGQLSAQRRARVEQIYGRYGAFTSEALHAWQRSRVLERELGAVRSALNLTDMGVMLVDRSSRLVFANDVASAMFERGDNLRLTNGLLRATRLQSSIQLQMALEHVINANARCGAKDPQHRRAPLLSIERENGPPLIMAVLPIEEPALEATDIAAAVYVMDPTGNMEDLIQPVCKVYRLSPVETRLACLLTAGETIIDAAKKMRIKEMTARSYLKQIFLKTNTKRQTSLVHLMLCSVIRTGPAIIAEPI